MNVIRSSDTSAVTRATRRHIPEDGMLQSWSCLCFNAQFLIQGAIVIQSLEARGQIAGVTRSVIRWSRCPEGVRCAGERDTHACERECCFPASVCSAAWVARSRLFQIFLRSVDSYGYSDVSTVTLNICQVSTLQFGYASTTFVAPTTS
jgi:hypothetical protein